MADRKIVITMGDPAGIGAEIIVKSFEKGELRDCVVVGNKNVLKKAFAIFNIYPKINYDWENPKDDELNLFDMDNVDMSEFHFGESTSNCGLASYQYIEKAVSLCLQGKFNVLVTAPINKVSLRMAHLPYIGHTEMISHLTNSRHPLTLFQTGNLRTFFLTRHLSIMEMLSHIKKEEIVNTSLDCLNALKAIDISDKPFAIAALNPHAGDGGQFGDEEIKEIIPAVEELRNKGYNVVGPIPADSVYDKGKRGEYSAILSLYHDQGHIATKTLDFLGTVSLTLNCKVLRVSVDHGTAYDIAGKGIANETSLLAAIEVAREINNNAL